MTLFSMTPPGFKVTPFFDAEYLKNGTRYRHGLSATAELLASNNIKNVISDIRDIKRRIMACPVRKRKTALPNCPVIAVIGADSSNIQVSALHRKIHGFDYMATAVLLIFSEN